MLLNKKYNDILTSLGNGILTITFNRPETKNAIGYEAMKDITEVLVLAASDEAVDFIILTGKGDFYSSGADLAGNFKMIEETSINAVLDIGKKFIANLIDFPKLIIAVVNGPAIGIAFTTLGLCDIVYCSTKAYFWAPFTHHGLNAEGCSSYLFPKSMGNVKANEVLQFGRKLTAWEAKECNLVTDVYEPEELNSIVLPKIHKLRNELAIRSVHINKKLTREWEKSLLHKINAAEWKALEESVTSHDFMQSVLKFMNRKSDSMSKL